MKDSEYGNGYEYAHDSPFATTDMGTFPDRFQGRKYYVPGNLGLEKDIKKRIEWWEKIKVQITKQKVVKSKDSAKGPERKRKNQKAKKRAEK